jgi:L-fucose isomerase-like protein
VDKIRLIEAIQKLKAARILVITPYQQLAQVDYQGDRLKRFPDDYNETYTRTLKELLGVELVRVQPEEFYDAVKEVDQQKARDIARMWIAEAAAMKDTTESEVVKTAKSYLAFDALREKYDCNAVSTQMRSLTGTRKLEDIFWPGLGLMEFQKRGIQAICQEYENIMVTHLLGYYLAGRPSMLGDLMIDTFNNVSIVTHCGAPLNFCGDDARLPYIIRSHAQSPVRGTSKPGSSTGVQVEFPVGEPVTIWKVYVLHKKIGLHTGTIVDGRALYAGLDDFM